MEDIIESVKRLASNTDGNGHQELMDGLRNLSYSLETPSDTIQRLGYAHLEIAAVHIGIDLNLFEMLATNIHPLTVVELHQKTGAALLLLGRLLRCLASVGTIKEVDTDRFTSTNITETLATPGVQASIRHQFNNCGPLYQELPGFLNKINYSDITDNHNTVHQVAHKTTLHAGYWYMHHPEAVHLLNLYLIYHCKNQAICWDIYPVEEETQGWDLNAPVLVDMTNWLGHMSTAFKQKFPKVPGQVILQDLPISLALPPRGVRRMIHDMFNPQTVKGAKFYYLGRILHEWPDYDCQRILANIVPAMSPASRILIDEIVLLDTRVPWQSTSIDLTMMAAVGGRQRTRTQWAELLKSVGLEIEAVRCYAAYTEESIMTVKLDYVRGMV